jgi:hypothetical protein
MKSLLLTLEDHRFHYNSYSNESSLKISKNSEVSRKKLTLPVLLNKHLQKEIYGGGEKIRVL